MKNKNEVVPIQFIEKPAAPSKPASAKLALRLKQPNGKEIYIYNGINQYILREVLKELN